MFLQLRSVSSVWTEENTYTTSTNCRRTKTEAYTLELDPGSQGLHSCTVQLYVRRLSSIQVFYVDVVHAGCAETIGSTPDPRHPCDCARSLRPLTFDFELGWRCWHGTIGRNSTAVYEFYSSRARLYAMNTVHVNDVLY